jgi:hypothetical protein
METKGNCFVIQPFDKSKFDKRFDDHFVPAIEAAGLIPYRVDRDPSVRVPIESIHTGINDSVACLADITMDNPNVWYELGYALARGKEVIIVCCKEERATDFPFDVRHLTITSYSTGSGSDFIKLEEDITSQLTARISESEKMRNIASMSPVQDVEGLSPHEIAALSVIFADRTGPGSAIDIFDIKREMEKAGFTPLAVNLSLESLGQKDLAKFQYAVLEEGGDPMPTYVITKSGIQWIMKNQEKLVLRAEDTKRQLTPYGKSAPFGSGYSAG